MDYTAAGAHANQESELAFPRFFAVLAAAAAVSANAGAQDLAPPIQALQKKGLEITGELPAAGGLKGYAGHMGQQPYALYLTPDGQHVIVGSVFDAHGENLTRSSLEQAVAQPMTKQTLKLLEDAAWVADGDAKAPRVVYVFSDPNCPYCHQFWKQSRPWVQDGKVQLRHILVGVLRDTSPGKAAAILASADPSRALADHENRAQQGGIAPLSPVPAKQQAQLQANQALMAELEMQGTPAIFYLKDGLLQAQTGAPRDEDLEEILGKR